MELMKVPFKRILHEVCEKLNTMMKPIYTVDGPDDQNLYKGYVELVFDDETGEFFDGPSKSNPRHAENVVACVALEYLMSAVLDENLTEWVLNEIVRLQEKNAALQRRVKKLEQELRQKEVIVID